MSIASGIGWHMVGAASAAAFYAPISKVKRWSWETTWAVAGFFSWVLFPIGVSLLLLPDFRGFYHSLDRSVVLQAVLFGAMWGIGNISYGLTMRYMGMSLGIGVAIGVTLIIGTLIPPALHGDLAGMVRTTGGELSLSGVVIALIGIGIVTLAGHQKEERLGRSAAEFDLTKGLVLAVLCGVFSSGMSFAIDASKPIQALAEAQGINPLYAALPSYVLIMGGGALVNFAYCFLRLAFKKELSLRADLSLPASSLLTNGAMAATGGIMWYFQFFFYAWGAASIPQHLGFVNWMLHMSGYVLFGGLVGLALKEWQGVGRRPIAILCAGMAVIILAANLVGIGMSF
ncbi:L-rhamnose-H+ transport protein [Rhizomicrobium palustre]|uniref:L-rhamnose-H+ transport protein n=1 Tax=Rhizomicrobium palustre TaxID=189966 RepID=A0A846N1N4_9PROT|nr:L-rhamnose/proton symporter RhaT [Rhizomicrobium palustre]NIK89132.1 L-rhamnose-H+ transport protein [Rhizomicrobium palustre]